MGKVHLKRVGVCALARELIVGLVSAANRLLRGLSCDLFVRFCSLVRIGGGQTRGASLST